MSVYKTYFLPKNINQIYREYLNTYNPTGQTMIQPRATLSIIHKIVIHNDNVSLKISEFRIKIRFFPQKKKIITAYSYGSFYLIKLIQLNNTEPILLQLSERYEFINKHNFFSQKSVIFQHKSSFLLKTKHRI